VEPIVFQNVKLQTKIIVLIICLILLIVILLNIIFIYLDYKQTEQYMEKLGMQTAQTVSFMPTVKEGLLSIQPTDEMQVLVNQIIAQVDAAEVFVMNNEYRLYAHSDSNQIGKTIKDDDIYTTQVFGGYVIKNNSDSNMITAMAPIYNDFENYSQMIGAVSVSFSKKDLRETVLHNIVLTSIFSVVVIGIGTFGGMLLAKNIKKQTMGLEPNEIALIYRERNAILLSIKEGILAVDRNRKITLLNQSGKEMLGISNEASIQNQEIVNKLYINEVFRTGTTIVDKEVIIGSRILIINSKPIIGKSGIEGVVTSFRDRTEIQEMIHTLSEVREYSEDLRAQTHEFTNKLYVISGLLQLGHYTDAIEFIQQEQSVNEKHTRIVFEQILDPNLQAILLGKLGKASEKRIDFTIDPNSSLNPLPSFIQIAQLTTVIGNLIDNAFEAVEAIKSKEHKQVTFFATDIGHDIILEITDNGIGIVENKVDELFTKGYSTKSGANRGYGLFNVQQIIDKWNGVIEVKTNKTDGTIFTVFIPKH